jgi:hypothetical protein
MKVLARISKIALITLTASQAFAGGIFTPISADSAAVLPKGVRNMRLGGFTTQVTDKFDGYGSVVPTANSFNKSVSYDKLISSRPDRAEQAQLRGGLTAEGVNLSDTAGEAQGLVNARITTTVPVLAYGLTDKITLGLGIPIMYSSTHVDTGWAASNGFNSTMARLQTVGFETRIQGLKNDLYNVVATQIAAYGYKPMADEQHTDIGDATLGAKMQIVTSPKVDVAVSMKAVLPTGRTPDVDKVVDIAPGDGHVSTGVGIVADYKLSSKFVLTPSASYLYQFAADHTVRIPRTSDESISPDKDYNTNVKKGDIMGAALNGRYNFVETMTVGLGYSFQYKNPDVYQGSTYDLQRYTYLAQDTFQYMHSVLVSFTASTIPLFKKHQFAVPLDATVAFAHVLDGRNVGALDVAILDIAAYF